MSRGLAMSRGLEKCNQQLIGHVNLHQGGHVQGSAAWLLARGTMFGGSEIAALMGKDPYKTKMDLIARKIGLDTGGSVGVACWWGTLFEPVSERVVELDCGTTIYGASIHVRWADLPYHGNSPDGYCTLILEYSDGRWQICHDLDDAALENRFTVPLPVLVELKAPYRRLPTTSPPSHYVPQVWSGIAMSPPTLAGLFVDIVYRVCTLAELGDSADYATEYHLAGRRSKTPPPSWEGAFAWGATALYAPRIGTRAIRARPQKPCGTADIDAYRILCSYLGYDIAMSDLGAHVADLGELASANASQFDKILEHTISTREIQYVHSDPVGMGRPPGDSLCKFLADAEANAPEHHYLMGLLPWKIFQVNYHLIHERLGFLEEVDDLTSTAMRDILRLRQAPNLHKAFYDYRMEQPANAGRSGDPSSAEWGNPVITPEQKKSFFTWSAARPAAGRQQPTAGQLSAMVQQPPTAGQLSAMVQPTAGGQSTTEVRAPAFAVESSAVHATILRWGNLVCADSDNRHTEM